MADLKISQLTAISVLTPATDVLPVVDVGGVTKKITTNQILGSGGTATLASATITGDLTVDTSTLKVDSTNNRVGIGTASPSVQLHLAGTDTTNVLFAGVTKGIRFVQSASTSLITGVDNTGAASYQPLSIGGSALDFSLSGTTAMTLNSTGLGIGGSASYKLDVVGPVMRLINSAATADIFITDSGTTNGNVRLRGESNALKFITGGGVSATIDSSGNVGIGVTPSYKLHVAGANPTAAINSTTASISSIATLLYRNVDGNSATQSVASIAGETAGNGGYGNLIFSTGFNGSLVERMRIDLSGNLILQSSATPATLGTNGMLTVNATSNTNLRFSYRGSDGTTRVANLTLA